MGGGMGLLCDQLEDLDFAHDMCPEAPNSHYNIQLYFSFF